MKRLCHSCEQNPHAPECPYKEYLGEPDVHDLARRVRDVIDRQVDTTPCGKRLVELDARAVAALVRNVVGNLVNGLVMELIHEAKEGT